jgi:hypothetical protein
VGDLGLGLAVVSGNGRVHLVRHENDRDLRHRASGRGLPLNQVPGVNTRMGRISYSYAL